LTEITHNGSIVHVVMCVVGVWRHNLNCNEDENH
jgi:hypothetical protein